MIYLVIFMFAVAFTLIGTSLGFGLMRVVLVQTDDFEGKEHALHLTSGYKTGGYVLNAVAMVLIVACAMISWLAVY